MVGNHPTMHAEGLSQIRLIAFNVFNFSVRQKLANNAEVLVALSGAAANRRPDHCHVLPARHRLKHWNVGILFAACDQIQGMVKNKLISDISWPVWAKSGDVMVNQVSILNGWYLKAFSSSNTDLMHVLNHVCEWFHFNYSKCNRKFCETIRLDVSLSRIFMTITQIRFWGTEKSNRILGIHALLVISLQHLRSFSDVCFPAWVEIFMISPSQSFIISKGHESLLETPGLRPDFRTPWMVGTVPTLANYHDHLHNEWSFSGYFSMHDINPSRLRPATGALPHFHDLW